MSESSVMNKPVRYALLTDAPPLASGGHGCNILSMNWCRAMTKDVGLIITRREHRARSPLQIGNGLTSPIILYHDSSGIPGIHRCGFLQGGLNLFLFILALPQLRLQLQKHAITRIFVFSGGNFIFLLQGWLLAFLTRLPSDLYVVDDFASLANMSKRLCWAWLIHATEKPLMKSYSQVYAISKGFAEHLQRSYQIPVKWLPIVAKVGKYHQESCSEKYPYLLFLGGVNPLYEEGLIDLVKVLETLSESRLKLKIATYTDARYLPSEITESSVVEILIKQTQQQIESLSKSCSIIFLPYSFQANLRRMVTTSFSTKLTDGLSSGKTMLVYGPAAASLPRLFTEMNLPVVITERAMLLDGVRKCLQLDQKEVKQMYENKLFPLFTEQSCRSRLIIDYPSQNEQ